MEGRPWKDWDGQLKRQIFTEELCCVWNWESVPISKTKLPVSNDRSNWARLLEELPWMCNSDLCFQTRAENSYFQCSNPTTIPPAHHGKAALVERKCAMESATLVQTTRRMHLNTRGFSQGRNKPYLFITIKDTERVAPKWLVWFLRLIHQLKRRYGNSVTQAQRTVQQWTFCQETCFKKVPFESEWRWGLL